MYRSGSSKPNIAKSVSTGKDTSSATLEIWSEKFDLGTDSLLIRLAGPCEGYRS